MADDAEVLNYFQVGLELYDTLLAKGVPREEARQVLPGASGVNLLMTWNIRSLINMFEQRCCNRNVMEMRIFANRMHQICREWWPEFALCVGPQCYTGKCKQGKMRCAEKKWDRKLGVV